MNGRMEMNGPPKSRMILITAQAIADYIGISKPSLYDLVREGLPVAIIGRCMVAHAQNIEEFMQRRTRGRLTEVPPDAE